MKKILLVLFLMLGVVSFSAPKYLNTNKLENAGYEIFTDDEDVFVFGKSTNDTKITLAFTDRKESNKDTAKKASDEFKAAAPSDEQYLSTRENKRAYIHKFKSEDGYTYAFTGKKSKVKNWYISGMYVSRYKELKDNELDKVIDSLLNEAESFIK